MKKYNNHVLKNLTPQNMNTKGNQKIVQEQNK